MQKRILVGVVVIILLGVFVLLAFFSRREQTLAPSSAWSPPSSVSSTIFHGPTGAPFIKGPSGPPPQ